MSLIMWLTLIAKITAIAVFVATLGVLVAEPDPPETVVSVKRTSERQRFGASISPILFLKGSFLRGLVHFLRERAK